MDQPKARSWRVALVALACAVVAGLLLGTAVLSTGGPFAASADTPSPTGQLAWHLAPPSTAPGTFDRAANASLKLVPSAPPVSPSAGPPSVVRDVPFTTPVGCGRSSCQVQLDIYVPAGPGPFSTIVLIRGGPSGLGGRSYLDPFAAELASAGILVFNADYRDTASQGGGYPAAFEDVACAVRFARVEASRYRGDSGPVTLVGHSLGGWVGSVVALDPTEFEGGCLASGSGRPDAFVGLAGNYQIDSGQNEGDLSAFFGGSADETADARAASNPFNYATGTSVPVRLVAGTADTTVDPAASVALNAFLEKHGWNVSLELVPGAAHSSIIATGSDSQASMRAVFAAVAAARHAG